MRTYELFLRYVGPVIGEGGAGINALQQLPTARGLYEADIKHDYEKLVNNKPIIKTSMFSSKTMKPNIIAFSIRQTVHR